MFDVFRDWTPMATNKCSAATVWWPSFVTGCLAAGKLMVTQSPRGSQGQSFPWPPLYLQLKTHDNIVKDIFFQTGWNSIYIRNFSGTCTILNKLPKFAVFHYLIIIRRHQGNCLPNCAGMYIMNWKKRLFARKSGFTRSVEMDMKWNG